MTATKFWESKGLGYSTIERYFKDADRQPRQVTAELLAPVLDMSLAELEKLCGGFADEGMRERILPYAGSHGKATRATRAKMSATRKGKPLSDEARKRMSAAQQRRWADPATREKMLPLLTGLRTLESRIKSIATRCGPERVRSNLDRYTERYAAEFRLGQSTARAIILRTLGDKVAPRTGRTLEGSKADIIRRLAADGMATAEIVQEGDRRDEIEPRSGWSYDYVYAVLYRARNAS